MMQDRTPLSVWCICMGIGFPGLAQANRILMVGRALQHAGADYRVCHLGANPLMKLEGQGVYRGIPYQYYPPDRAYARARWKRRIDYVVGMRQVRRDLRSAMSRGRPIAIYAWMHTNPATIGFRRALRSMGVPIVTEMNEWWPGWKSHLRRMMSIRQSDGLLVISDAIEDRVRRIRSGRRIPILKVPVLAEPAPLPPQSRASAPPFIMWCGNAASSAKDIRFLTDIMAELARRAANVRLLIAGRTTPDFMAGLRSRMDRLQLPHEQIEASGYLSEADLSSRMAGAVALLLPLWADEERSVCRFPTKLAEYLFSARPVITSAVGEACKFLVGGESAILCPSGDVSMYANAVEELLLDPAKAERVGRAGRQVACTHFDYRVHALAVKRFFMSVLDG